MNCSKILSSAENVSSSTSRWHSLKKAAIAFKDSPKWKLVSQCTLRLKVQRQSHNGDALTG